MKKSGAWFSYQDTRIGQGRDNAKNFLRENPDIAAELEKTPISNVGRYSARTLPAAGALVRPEDIGETQMKLDI